VVIGNVLDGDAFYFIILEKHFLKPFLFPGVWYGEVETN